MPTNPELIVDLKALDDLPPADKRAAGEALKGWGQDLIDQADRLEYLQRLLAQTKPA